MEKVFGALNEEISNIETELAEKQALLNKLRQMKALGGAATPVLPTITKPGRKPGRPAKSSGSATVLDAPSGVLKPRGATKRNGNDLSKSKPKAVSTSDGAKKVYKPTATEKVTEELKAKVLSVMDANQKSETDIRAAVGCELRLTDVLLALFDDGKVVRSGAGRATRWAKK